jgi:CHAT domain-containing protein
MPRQQHELSALIAVANPDGLEQYAPGGTPLAPVDVERELQRARDALGQHPVTVLASRGEANLHNIIGWLEASHPDILYLVCHGALLGGQPRLYLETPNGEVAPTNGSDLIEKLIDLSGRPMLVFLSACQSAGAGDEASSRDDGALATLGPQLAQAGIPAVVAMQANVSLRTAQTFTQVFFAELAPHGIVDEAMAAARRSIRERLDWWVPVLFSRLRSGRMYYRPEFAERGRESWRALELQISQGSLTPVLGWGLTDSILGSRESIARRWVERWQMQIAPQDKGDLAKVAQYLQVRSAPGPHARPTPGTSHE